MSAFTRRAVLMSGGAAAVIGAVIASRAQAAPAQPRLWLDASLPHSNPRPDVLLQPELVAQWRGELLAQLRGRGESVTALVRWDKAMLLVGLAREEGWKTRIHRKDQGVFRVDVIV